MFKSGNKISKISFYEVQKNKENIYMCACVSNKSRKHVVIISVRPRCGLHIFIIQLSRNIGTSSKFGRCYGGPERCIII